MKKIITQLSICAIAILLFCNLTAYGQTGYTLDHTVGAFGNSVKPGQPIEFHLRLQNNSGENVVCVTNGFRVYLSNNGELSNGQFQTIQIDGSLVDWASRFDLVTSIHIGNSNGFGADTAFAGALSLFVNEQSGFENGFDSVVAVISTSVDAAFAGDSLCIDSSFAQPTGSWLWAFGTTANLSPPSWSGPHCFEILPSCCINFAGNYDNSDDDIINVLDIEYLIGYMFRMGDAPLCFDEADLNNDSMIDIADLTYMVEYMFLLGPQPTDCP